MGGLHRWGAEGTAAALLACLSGLLLLLAIRSLHARIEQDSPIMFYLAYLLDHFHTIPYRDTFDMNMPGSYLLYVLLGRAGGYRDAGLRVVDLGLVSLLIVCTWFALRRMGRLTAWTACVLFPLAYLVKGNEVSLQREFLILVFLSLALALLFNVRTPESLLGSGLIGLLLGVCVTVKPQIALIWPLFPLYQVQTLPASLPRRDTVRRSLWLASLAGFLLPLIVMITYLISVHALGAFRDIVQNYWPLYGALNGENHALYGVVRVKYLVVNTLKFSTNAGWIPPALFGLWIALKWGQLSSEQTRQIKLLAALGAFFCLYPAFSGQFWAYHGLPLLYFAVLLTALSFVSLPSVGVPRWLPPARMAVLALLLLAFGHWVKKYQPTLHPRSGRPDQIASYLAAHLHPGDRVQPLDWTGGAVQAMLMTRAQIATPFVYDFYFYHHVSHPYIQDLRRRFLLDLTGAHPRFIIEITSEDKPWPSGRDTTRRFPALQDLLRAQYHPVQNQNGYILWERDESQGPVNAGHAG